MNRGELIRKLQNLEFVCIDDNEIERRVWELGGFEQAKDFLESTLDDRKRYISLKAKQMIDNFNETQNWYNDFHLIAHLIILDTIIGLVGAGLPVRGDKIEHTFGCSEGAETLQNALFEYNQCFKERIAS